MSNKKQNKTKDNYLDRIPVINDKKWNVLEDGLVEVVVENKGFYHSIAQRFFHKPRYSFIKLDAYGSCVWQEIDGRKTIYEIGQILQQNHKGAANQLYERLARFFGILEQNKYIRFVRPEEVDRAGDGGDS